jgi:hypothetical protein
MEHDVADAGMATSRLVARPGMKIGTIDKLGISRVR